MWRGSRPYKRAFLQSLFAGDGSSSLLPRKTIQVSYSTYSKQLAKDVQLLLLEFGVISRLCHYEKGETKVVITNKRDARRFMLDVGFLGAKQRKLEAALAAIPRQSTALSQDHIPYVADYIRKDCGSRSVDKDWLRRHNVDRVERWEQGGTTILERIASAEVKAVVEPLVTGDYYYAEVASVEDAGMQPVYSLRVDTKDHSFLTNGFVSHNTEARLSKIATELLRDIDANTVDFEPNYDESRRQPSVLPSRFPNLLVNGSTGIAVGMATNMPPHHLGETIDAVVAMIDNPDIDVEGLMKHIKGPDFPTGAFIVGRSGIRDAYRTGRGRVVMRARAHIEELRGGKSAIVISELPYGVKKGGDSGVIRKIADLVQEKVITEVSDLADHSDRTGMRIQVELKRDAVPQVALNKLFKHTPLQSTFGYNAVALVDGIPKTLSLLELITHYLEFQREVVIRRSKDELQKKERAAHVLEGYLRALEVLDEIIALIRAASDVDDARSQLMAKYDFSEIQAQAILDLRLRALTALERHKVEAEYKDLQERIAELRAILGDPARIDGLIREELLEIKQVYGKSDDRRTEIVHAEEELELEDLIAEEDMVIAITQSGYIKRLPVTAYREQKRGGIGVMGMELKDEDYIEHLFVASTHDYILFFTNVGKVYRLKVHELPLGLAPVEGPRNRQSAPVQADRDRSRRRADARLQRGEVPGVRNEERRRQEDRAEGVQHEPQSRRDHRDQDARRRRARGCSALIGRRRHPHGLEARPGDPVQREGSARDGARRIRRPGHAHARQGRSDLDQHRAGRRRSACRYRERLRQAHPHRRLPAQGSRRDGREDDSADRVEGHARRRPRRSRRIPGDAHLDRRHGDQDAGRRDQATRPRNARRDRDAAPRRRAGLRARPGGRVR